MVPRTSSKLLSGLTLLFLILFITGCSKQNVSSSESLKDAESPSLKICRDVLGLVHEADSGIMTDFELRERYKLIYEKTKTLNDKALLSEVTKILAAVTRGNKDEYFAALHSFTSLCSDRLGSEKTMELLGADI
jgi:hypothetical protein